MQTPSGVLPAVLINIFSFCHIVIIVTFLGTINSMHSMFCFATDLAKNNYLEQHLEMQIMGRFGRLNIFCLNIGF
jgi:hypothetical protein